MKTKLVLHALVLGFASLCVAQTDGDAPAVEGAWEPAAVDAAAYRDIVDYNIFEADRAGIARRVAADRRPPPERVDNDEPTPPPQHRDFDHVLIGVALHGEERFAFVEDRRDGGRVLQIEVPGEFSDGRLETINAAGVTYRVDGEERRVGVGFNFKGEAIAATPPAERPAATPSTRRDEDDERREAESDERRQFSPEDIARFRERRGGRGRND